jgi:hypothetical protein
MRVGKTVWVAALFSATMWSAPALAGHDKGWDLGPTRIVRDTDVSKTSLDAETGETGEALTGSRSNKGGELRGLNRADAAAGENGEAGRTKAASKHRHKK